MTASLRRLGWVGFGLLTVAALVFWEIRTPRLPVRFEKLLSFPLWQSRLEMALAGALGIAAVFALLARLVDRRAAAYVAAILATTPIWFVHARTSTGVMLPMAAGALVLAGLGVGLIDPRTKSSNAVRGIALAASLVGIVIAGATRGLLVCVAPAAIGVGLATFPKRRGIASLALGLAITAASLAVIDLHLEGRIAEILAGPRALVPHAPTFDLPVLAIAYAFLPWTPLLPVALARRPSSDAHRAITIAAVLAIAAHALVAPRSGPLLFAGAAPIACVIALALRSLEDITRPAIAVVAMIVAIGALLAHDVEIAPDRVMAALGAPDLALPAAHAEAASRALRSATWLSVALGAAALLAPSTWLPTNRGLAVLAAGVFAGLTLRAYAYPTLLARLSPGEAFEAYAERHKEGEPLAALGVDRRVIADTTPLADAESAAKWLAEAPDPRRRFLALANTELPRVNAAFRSARGTNVPVLAGGDGSVLLAASALGGGEKSESMLDAIVLGAPPPGLHPIGATLGDRLEAIGWEIQDERGAVVSALKKGKKGHLRIAIRVGHGAAPLAGYCTFIHVDHRPTRFSIEHKEQAYPMTLWREGDIVMDDFDVSLPPHFGAGTYAFSWGIGVLPCEDDRRMPITSGPNDGHGRVLAGSLEVK